LSAPYDTTQDYIAYSIMGETEPFQYGYTVPETQLITSDGSSEYDLIYNLSGVNPENAIVEVNGVRQSLLTDYNIYSANANVVFTTVPSSGDTIAITTFNETERQYFNTQWNLTGKSVSSIINVDNEITAPLATTTATATNNTNNIITVTSTDGFIAGQNVIFKPLVVQADTLTAGLEYQIYVSGDTVWTSIGAPNNEVGTIFTATGAAPTTANMGSATLADFGGIDTTGLVYVVAAIPSTEIVASSIYRIVELGTTNWNSIGYIGTPAVGGTFTATGSAAGTGTAFGTTTFKVTYANTVTPTLTTFSSATVVAVVGGNETVTVTTSSATGFTENEYVTIDNTPGSVQLNNASFYVHIINDNKVALYTAPYSAAYSAINSPVTTVSTYQNPPGGGYIWAADSFIIKFTDATASNGLTNRLTVTSTAGLVEKTPVIFTEQGKLAGDTIMGGLEYGKTYYIFEIGGSDISVSETIDALEAIALTTDTGSITVSQFEQINVDRLYVTVNGYRVPSSSLRLNNDNILSILVPITTGDMITITSMMPTATPDENVYLQFVNTLGQGSVYRDNSLSRTWLTKSLYELETSIQVAGAEHLVKIINQTYTGTEVVEVDNYYTLSINADKNQIVNISVYNQTKGREISKFKFNLVVQELSPKIQITPGSYIDNGDTILITVLEGNTIMVNGELIRFGSIDLLTNTLSDLQRGYNNSPVNDVIPKYAEVYGLLSENKMSETDYNQTWNSYVYNTTSGDPLQISWTGAAEFLRVDN
jgi:hypothetical protein